MHFYLESLFAGEGFAGAQQCNACWRSLFKAVGGNPAGLAAEHCTM